MESVELHHDVGNVQSASSDSTWEDRCEARCERETQVEVLAGERLGVQEPQLAKRSMVGYRLPGGWAVGKIAHLLGARPSYHPDSAAAAERRRSRCRGAGPARPLTYAREALGCLFWRSRPSFFIKIPHKERSTMADRVQDGWADAALSVLCARDPLPRPDPAAARSGTQR